jgi:hypothetical protein
MLASESAPDASVSSGAAASGRPRRSWPRPLIGGAALAVWLGTAWWHTHKPLAPGTHLASGWYAAGSGEVRLVADITTADAYGRPVMSHAAFDEMLRIVQSAREFIVIDAFRLSSEGPASAARTPLRHVAAQLRDALIARKRAEPRLRVLFIVDPASEAFGAAPSSDLTLLKDAGVDVVPTNLDALRDSNYLYSSLWRIAVRWWGAGEAASGEGSRSPGLRAWLAAANLKADRRNLLIADDGRGGLAGIVSATELSEAGAADSNVAVRLSGPVLVPLLSSETAIARFSGWTGVLGAPTDSGSDAAAPRQGSDPPAAARAVPDSPLEARVLTEGAIREALLARLGTAGRGDSIDIAAFYLSDRAVIESLVAASRRGAAVRLILDPGEDAFGRTGAGIPNRSVAGELLAASDGAIRVRWYRTHGERFHASLALIYDSRQLWLTAGSASLTRRSLGDYDLDANAALLMPRNAALAQQSLDYFETLWSNQAALGIEYTADVGTYADASQLHYWRYRLMEATGLADF